MQNEKINVLKGVAEDMRHDILEMCHNCGRQNGHLGGCMSSVEILAVLYTEIMNLVEANQGRIPWDDRDRFIMSKGHAGIAMYAALKQVGVLPQSVIDGKIRGENSIIYRHPKMNTDYAIECSVGSLGMGLGYGIGLCEALNRKLSDAKVYVMLGDGECNEGSIWESAAYAGAHGLDKLTVIVDKNKLQLDGYTSQILSMDNLENKWRAFGFKTIEIDGHNFEDIHNAFRIEHTGKPLAIIANTTKGKGCSFAENLVDWHDNWLTDDLYKQAKNEIGDTLLRNKALQIAEYRYNARDPQYSRHENADGSGYLDYSEDNIAQWNSLDSKHVLGSIFEKFANQDKKFLLLFADCANRINIKEMLIKYPDQCLEMGIAEQNMITVASALANEGFHVFAVAYAPFITARVLDQIRVNLGYMCAPVKLVGLSAGLASSDLGATHTAFEDIANMRSIPNMLIESPADQLEIVKTLDHIKNLNSPAYIRITIQPKKKNLHTSDYRFSTGSVEKIYGKNDILVLTTGALFINVLEAVERLEHLGYDMSVYNIHTIKPMGKEVEELIKKYQVIVTVEEHNIIGGLGTAVSELASNYNNNKTLKRIGIPDCFFYADVPTELLDIAGISTNKLIGAFLEILNDLSDSKLGEGNSQR